MNCPVCNKEDYTKRCSGHAVTMELKLPLCDFCTMTGDPDRQTAKYDGKTKMGPWAYMCEPHFQRYGSGLGTGVGQMLVVEDA